MTDVTILTHFSSPTWPVVNKLRGICKCLGVAMVHCSSLETLKEKMAQPIPGRVLFFTDEGLIDTVQEFELRPERPSFEVAMFISSPISSVAQRLTKMKVVKYLIGIQSEDSYGRDLSILIKKFANSDILDLDKYLAFGSIIHTREITTSKQKKEAIEAVSAYISQLGDPGYNHPFHEYARRVSELADELLLNAIFNANPRLHDADRSKAFHLTAEEKVTMAWGYDGDFFGVSVRDPFGKFTSETIMQYLSAQKTIQQVMAGESGGLGLKFIFEKAHKLITNVREEQVTEVIALIKFATRMTEFESHKKSFYFFAEFSKKEI